MFQPSRIDKFHIKEDTKQFSRRLRLREYFYDPDVTNNEINPFK